VRNVTANFPRGVVEFVSSVKCDLLNGIYKIGGLKKVIENYRDLDRDMTRMMQELDKLRVSRRVSTVIKDLASDDNLLGKFVQSLSIDDLFNAYRMCRVFDRVCRDIEREEYESFDLLKRWKMRKSNGFYEKRREKMDENELKRGMKNH
jgi:hypothetical protein